MTQKLYWSLAGLSILCLFTACSEGESGPKSAQGESCTKTADCETGLRCIELTCVSDTADGDSAEQEPDVDGEMAESEEEDSAEPEAEESTEGEEESEEIPSVCSGSDYTSSFEESLPGPGTTLVLLTSFLQGEAEDADFLFEGPSTFRAPATLGCMFKTAAGHYTVKVQSGSTTLFQKEVDLPDNQMLLIGIFDTVNGKGLGTAPVDYSLDDGKVRLVLLHLAQDNVDKPLDLYRYNAGTNTPEGPATLIKANVPFGGYVTEVEQEIPTFLAEEVAGHAPTGQYYDYLPPCGCSTVLIVGVIWCDTTQILDEGGGPCNAQSGGSKYMTSLDGISRF